MIPNCRLPIPGSWPPSSILAVDDSPELLELLDEILSAAGYQVRTAGSGESALAAVAANPPDLILLDLLMKSMDGLEVCRRLKAGKETQHIPIILLSGFAGVNEWVAGLQAGIADFIAKPFQSEELLTRVKTHLALTRAHATLEQQATALRQANEQMKAEIGKRQQVEDELRLTLDRAERSRRAMLSTLEDRMRTEVALRESEMMLRKAQEIIHLGHFKLNPTTGVVEGSDELFRIFGLTREECQFSDFTNKVPADQHEFLISTIQKAMDRKIGCNIEHSLQFRDGTVKFVNVIAECVTPSPAGHTVLMGTVQDITERKQAEEEKTKLQAQLNQAQKMESLGVLAGGIAHDFNNILGVIIGYTDMSREDAPPDSLHAKDLDRVLSSAHRAKDLVKQILAFSRQATVDRMPLKIQPLVKESLKMLRASIPTTITIKENIHPRCGTVLVDPTQVQQIVMNMCTNAFHAMEIGGGVLSVAVNTISIDHLSPLVTRQIPPGNYVELAVSDTGTGIRPEIIDKIFDPYFTTKEIGKGTGMGLAITHGIIKSYDGAITVDSTVGQGTTFHVYFPVVIKEAKEIEESQEAPRGKERILFVDDEELLAEMGKVMLERLGYTVTARRSSIEALETFINDPDQFDLVITDQTMPGMTGSDLARRMLQIKKDLPIILCTGFSYLVDQESAKAIGIKEFAFKPLTMTSIGQLIRKVLNEGQAI